MNRYYIVHYGHDDGYWTVEDRGEMNRSGRPKIMKWLPNEQAAQEMADKLNGKVVQRRKPQPQQPSRCRGCGIASQKVLCSRCATNYVFRSVVMR